MNIIPLICSATWRNNLMMPMQKEAIKLITVEDLQGLYEKKGDERQCGAN